MKHWKLEIVHANAGFRGGGRNWKFDRGFTLIELLITISLIAALSAVGVAAFSNYNNVQVLNNATSDVVNTLQLAKSETMSQVKPTDCTDTDTLLGYKVTINPVDSVDSSRSSYSLLVLCGSKTVTVFTKKLPATVSFSFPVTVQFAVLTQLVSLQINNVPSNPPLISVPIFLCRGTCSNSTQKIIIITKYGTITQQ